MSNEKCCFYLFDSMNQVVWIWSCSSNPTKFFAVYLPTYWNYLTKVIKIFVDTGKSLSEALILAYTKPQYDKRLFIELPVQYMKTTSSEHVVYLHKFFWMPIQKLNSWFYEQSVIILWVSWCKNKCCWKRFACTHCSLLFVRFDGILILINVDKYNLRNFEFVNWICRKKTGSYYVMS